MLLKKIINFLKFNFGISISATICLVSLLGVFISYSVISYQNGIVHYFYQEGKPNLDFLSYITMEVPLRDDGIKNSWYDGVNKRWGAQYDFYLKNNTNRTLRNWNVQVTIPRDFSIDSSWNGIYTCTKNKVDVVPKTEYEGQFIAKKESYKFGFVMYSSKIFDEFSYLISGNLVQSPQENVIFCLFRSISMVSLIFLIAFSVSCIVYKKREELAEKELDAFIRLCARFIDTRDSYTKMHSTHVALYSKLIAQKMNLSPVQVRNIYFLGMLHDIGKVLIPREILCKDSRLDESEWEEMKRHTIYGAEILRGYTGIPNIYEAVLYHHERYDGKGYYNGLRKEEIPLVARIICVADSYDAMATNRSYRNALEKEKILAEFRNNSGTQFDPEIVDIMINLIESGEL